MNFVSIIVPAYNAQKTIQKCITSLLNLDYPQELFEIIIVDNNSSDKTAELIKSYSRVIYANERTQGRSFTRNTGAKIAKGNLLAFIDADVFLDKDWLKNLAINFQNENIGGGQGRVIPSNTDGQDTLNKFRIRQQNESTSGTNIILRLMYFESPMINSAACMYRKEAFEFVGGFDVLLERHEDIDLAKRVSLAGYDLVAESKSTAFVEYHGDGWWSYFVRSFSEGFTKQSYNDKWAQYFSTRSNKLEESKKDTNHSLASLKLNLHMVADEIALNILRAILSFDSYFLLKAINSSFKSAGRIWGMMKNSYPGKFAPKYRTDLLNRSVFLAKDIEIKIDEEIRFVLQNNEILYVVNISKNEILNFSNFNSLRNILNHRIKV